MLNWCGPTTRGICRYSAAMTRDDEKRIAAMMAKTLAMMCVRNTGLEAPHAGIVPVTHAGEHSARVKYHYDRPMGPSRRRNWRLG